eukprot:CAMPEP_0202858774 /NCGR_PEP_ID=MMETSP1391-20130828/1154_1 /ASSEMBLY_ACC=CAM_ASM_000867 /TAXON_ID=1034604 /ORGANISM="Chlamydomonas leiostraca, Strain SAG 11-49" /LENGTH=587 /DNA_ID=CAMNT_0049537727 /DNA_START=209 /DNA_END=1970 /DNA_ORIENTATION=-
MRAQRVPCVHEERAAEQVLRMPSMPEAFSSGLGAAAQHGAADLIALASKLLLDEQEQADGWEAFPTPAATSEQYAMDLKRHGAGANHHAHHHAAALAHAPSAPPLPGSAHPGGELGAFHEVLDMAPQPWLPDSAATACGGCRREFSLVRLVLRHHCRFCGGLFCGTCSAHAALLPPRFCVREPQRVCGLCAASLAPLQPYLAGVMAPASQPPVHDAHDWLALRSWLNAPHSPDMQGDLYKAANVINCFTHAARAAPEARLPAQLLAGCRGLVALSCARVAFGPGVGVYGTGVVVARGAGGCGWSAPCSVAVAALGWGFAVGAQLTDVVLVLTSDEAVAAFSGPVHVGVGGNLSVAVGPLGRSADAALLVGSGAPSSPAPAYAYSVARGLFAGVCVEGCVVRVRNAVNTAFYGLPLTPAALLAEGRVAPPVAAAPLYDALRAMTTKYEDRRRSLHSPSSSSHQQQQQTGLVTLPPAPASASASAAAHAAAPAAVGATAASYSQQHSQQGGAAGSSGAAGAHSGRTPFAAASSEGGSRSAPAPAAPSPPPPQAPPRPAHLVAAAEFSAQQQQAHAGSWAGGGGGGEAGG